MMNNKELATQIVQHMGGENNIRNLNNCLTRLRIEVKNRSHIDHEALKQVDGVLSVIDQETIQVVLGRGKVTKVANEIHENTSIDVSVDDSDEFDIAADTNASYK